MMMARSPVEHLRVHVRTGATREALEEVVYELGLQIADALHLQLQVDRRVRPAAEVERGDGERFVHRHDEVAGAIDPATIAERLRYRFAKRDADVLDRVMLIDVEIAGGLQGQIE